MNQESLVFWRQQGLAIGAAGALPDAPMSAPTHAIEMAVFAASICSRAQDPASSSALCGAAYGAILGTPWGRTQPGWTRDFAKGVRVGASMISEDEKQRRSIEHNFLLATTSAIVAELSNPDTNRFLVREMKEGISRYSGEVTALVRIDDNPFLALLEALDISAATLPAAPPTTRRATL